MSENNNTNNIHEGIYVDLSDSEWETLHENEHNISQDQILTENHLINDESYNINQLQNIKSMFPTIEKSLIDILYTETNNINELIEILLELSDDSDGKIMCPEMGLIGCHGMSTVNSRYTNNNSSLQNNNSFSNSNNTDSPSIFRSIHRRLLNTIKNNTNKDKEYIELSQYDSDSKD